MKGRNLLILTVVVAALAAWVLLYERHEPSTDEARERADKVFPTLDREVVAGIEIRRGEEHIVLAKDGEHWRLTAPIEFPAADAAISSLLGTLADLKVERRLAAGDVDPTAYGLDHPQVALELTTTDGARFGLEVGDETALGSNRALRRAGDDGLVLAPGWFVKDLEKDVDEWRSKDVLDVYADQVASIQVVAHGDRIEAVRVDDRWQLLAPVTDLADRDQMQGLVSDLNGLTVETFVAANADLAALGLEQPVYRITVVRSTGDQPSVLELGMTRGQDGATQIACRRDGRDVFWVRDTISPRLDKAPVRWRSAVVYPFDTWDVDGLTIARGGESLRLERAEGTWRSADGAEADMTAVSDRLQALAALKATDYDLVSPPSAEIGRVELVLDAADLKAEKPAAPLVLTFYAPLKQGGNALVTVSARPTVMAAPADAVEKILADPESLLTVPKPTAPTTPDEAPLNDS